MMLCVAQAQEINWENVTEETGKTENSAIPPDNNLPGVREDVYAKHPTGEKCPDAPQTTLSVNDSEATITLFKSKDENDCNRGPITYQEEDPAVDPAVHQNTAD